MSSAAKQHSPNNNIISDIPVGPQHLDYVEDYQDVLTSSETFDVEVFSIPGEGLFMAAANR